ncbi:MAG: tRNA (5-methylaminomethyl-2-thiouridine)(34)-methyltransferase MnmD [Rhodobacteraceae bacterium]|nr:tRNA (5-methylaminomethyl-2-thiouridine)(34)-methyltransferase MnmD [Paracoccaceae bacterium]
MADQQENAELEWRDGRVPVATRFDDPYYSLENGLEETRYVFLAGNGLPARYAPGFHVAELGFGTGLNLLCAWQAWELSGHPGQLQFTSFEAFPLLPKDMARAHRQWPELMGYSERFFAGWDAGNFCIETDTLSARVVIGDARETLGQWQGKADAWFLDGFSPTKNPELWGETLMADVARHTKPGGTFATYTAAGHVRQSLANAGFEVTRVKGFGRKRHMSVGTLTPE